MVAMVLAIYCFLSGGKAFLIFHQRPFFFSIIALAAVIFATVKFRAILNYHGISNPLKSS